LKRVLAALALAFLLALGANTASAQVVTTQMRQTGSERLTGWFVITPVSPGVIRVEITVTGLPPNAERVDHIHIAPGAYCDSGAPVVYPLTNLRAGPDGVGRSSTTVTLDKGPVLAGNAYINVHATAQGGPGVICGNISTSYAAAAPGQVAAPAPAAPAAPAPAAPAAPAAQVPVAQQTPAQLIVTIASTPGAQLPPLLAQLTPAQVSGLQALVSNPAALQAALASLTPQQLANLTALANQLGIRLPAAAPMPGALPRTGGMLPVAALSLLGAGFTAAGAYLRRRARRSEA
jgi:hypothetical protein